MKSAHGETVTSNIKLQRMCSPDKHDELISAEESVVCLEETGTFTLTLVNGPLNNFSKRKDLES